MQSVKNIQDRINDKAIRRSFSLSKLFPFVEKYEITEKNIKVSDKTTRVSLFVTQKESKGHSRTSHSQAFLM